MKSGLTGALIHLKLLPTMTTFLPFLVNNTAASMALLPVPTTTTVSASPSMDGSSSLPEGGMVDRMWSTLAAERSLEWKTGRLDPLSPLGIRGLPRLCASAANSAGEYPYPSRQHDFVESFLDWLTVLETQDGLPTAFEGLERDDSGVGPTVSPDQFPARRLKASGDSQEPRLGPHERIVKLFEVRLVDPCRDVRPVQLVRLRHVQAAVVNHVSMSDYRARRPDLPARTRR